MTPALPAAVLWDMDGTIVDTEPYWMTAEAELVRSFGGEWTDENAMEVVGAGLWEAAAVFQRHGVALEADEIVARMTERVRAQLAEHGVPWRPGARELLKELRDLGVRTALVTMSVRSMAQDIVDAIPFDAFDVLVTGDAVDQPKPHPEPYLAAATALDVDIADCVALEDSPPGVTSASTAGAVTVGIPHMVPLDGSPADAVWPTLAGRTAADLAALLATVRSRA